MTKQFSIGAIVAAIISIQAYADVTGPWAELGMPADGYWQCHGLAGKLSSPIGSFSSYDVYTNAQGRVFQFNFRHDLGHDKTKEDSIALIRAAERGFAKLLKLTEFTPHVDSQNQNRYFFSEEASLVDYPHWSIRFYSEVNVNGICVVKMSIWNCHRSLLSILPDQSKLHK